MSSRSFALRLRRVGAVAAEAAVRQQRTDLAGEVDPWRGRGLFVRADKRVARDDRQRQHNAKTRVGPGLQTRPTRRKHWRILSLKRVDVPARAHRGRTIIAGCPPHPMPGVSFPDHVALLSELLSRNHAIVEQIETRVLNVQGKDTARNRSRDYFDRLFSSCVYDTPGLPRELADLRGKLIDSHIADGFEPVSIDDTAHTLDPLELILRAYHAWEHGRWPGRNGRLSYARVLFGVFLLRQLEALSLRIWDDDPTLASDRLRDIQGLLDRLNSLLHPHVLIRDARWLIQTAQGPLTRHLAPYFRIADRIAESFTGAGRLELHAAGVKLAGNHLRSQLRYRGAELNLPVDDPKVLAVTRNSNAMDTALLVRDLVPLLDAYQAADLSGHSQARLDLADAILQGISADPELFLTRLDLLEPCTVLETLFVERGGRGSVRRTPMGSVHEDTVRRTNNW